MPTGPTLEPGDLIKSSLLNELITRIEELEKPKPLPDKDIGLGDLKLVREIGEVKDIKTKTEETVELFTETATDSTNLVATNYYVVMAVSVVPNAKSLDALDFESPAQINWRLGFGATRIRSFRGKAVNQSTLLTIRNESKINLTVNYEVYAFKLKRKAVPGRTQGDFF